MISGRGNPLPLRGTPFDNGGFGRRAFFRSKSCLSREHPHPPPSGAPSPLKGEGLRAATWGRPYGENGPGALARQTQAQTWNRAKNKFCKLRAQWPGGKLGTHSNFARRKRCTPSQECVPRNGVRGKRPMDLGGAKRSRSPSDASPGAFCLLCRHGQSRSPPAGGEIPREKPPKRRAEVVAPYKVSEICPLIRPLRGHLPPRGKALWGKGPHPPRGTAGLKSGRQNPPKKIYTSPLEISHRRWYNAF